MTEAFCEHINYEYAGCVKDYWVDTINNVRTRECNFKAHKGERYHVRHVEKYGYWDIVYKNDNIDDHEMHIIGQIPEKDFDEYFVRVDWGDVFKKKEENEKH